MKNKDKEYIKEKKSIEEKIFRAELILTPLLVIVPFLVGFLLIYDWYVRDFLWNDLNLLGELMLGIIIIIGNILFDIPFVKSLKHFSKN